MALASAAQVRVAHADAWEAEGRLRARRGGGVLRVEGARAMATGLPAAKWNNADLTSAEPDWDALAAWYAGLGVPWGVRVPIELSVSRGTPLFEKRCFALVPGQFDLPPLPRGISLRRIASADLPAYATLDATVFGGGRALSLRFFAPALGARGFAHWLACRGGSPVALAYSVATDGEAGPAAMVSGLGALPGFEHLLAALAARVASHALDAGAHFAHLHTGDPGEARQRLALGAREVPGLLVRVVVPG